MRLILILVLVCPMLLSAQSIEVESYALNPSSDINSLWKLRINLLGALGEPVWIKAEVKTRGQLVYYAVSEPLDLSSGLNVFDQYKIQIKHQSFQNKNIEDYVTSTGKLPKGLYTGCITMYVGTRELKTLCTEIKAENYAPPMLVFPYNEQELTQMNPTLSWIPPVPNAPTAISYSLKLVEIASGQTAQEALLKNPARMFLEGLETTTIPYGASALPLEVHKSYAWQVAAFVGSSKIGITEIWSFSIIELNPRIEELISKQDYFDINQSDFSRTISALKLLKIKYTEEQAKGRLVLKIYDVDGKEVLKKPMTLKNRSGDNYHIIDLTQMRGIKHEKQYLMTINHDSEGLLSRLSFVYLDPEKYNP